MRVAGFAIGLGLMLLTACSPAPETKAPEPPIVPETGLETFDDTGCLGYLLLQKTAISEGRAQGDAAALDAAVTAWRAAGARILSADELAQYETTSVAVQLTEPADVIAERSAECVTSAP